MKNFLLLCLTVLFAFTGCFSDDEDTIYYATFKINGVEKKFKVYDETGFSQSTDDTWSCTWQENLSSADSSMLTIRFPSDVSASSTFDEYSDIYIGYEDESGTYRLDDSDSITIQVTRWDGIGGLAQGSFSGTIDKKTSPYDTIIITDGVFKASIDW